MGLDAEFHDHCLVFSSKTGVTAFDGLVFHGDICGVTIFLVFGRVPGVALQRSWDTVTVSGSATAAFHG